METGGVGETSLNDLVYGEPWNGYYNDSFEFFNNKVPKLTGIETS